MPSHSAKDRAETVDLGKPELAEDALYVLL
jgi:hypothetical protein